MSRIMNALESVELEREKATPVSKFALLDFSSLPAKLAVPRPVETRKPPSKAGSKKPRSKRAKSILDAEAASVLEERIARAVEMVRCEREQCLAAEQRALHAEIKVNLQAQRIANLERQLERAWCDAARKRGGLDRMMALLDSIELPDEELN